MGDSDERDGALEQDVAAEVGGNLDTDIGDIDEDIDTQTDQISAVSGQIDDLVEDLARNTDVAATGAAEGD